MPSGRTKQELRKILAYFRDMIDYCRIERNPQMQAQYEQAWAAVARRLYGPLPDRWALALIQERLHPPKYAPQPESKPKTSTPPKWRQEILARPLRRIVKTVEEKHLNPNYPQHTFVEVYELLECGHMQDQPISEPGTPPAKRRRCKQCAANQARINSKKAAASVGQISARGRASA